MSACVPTRPTEPTDPAAPERLHQPHSPPPAPRRRFHLAGADVSASIAVFLIALPLSLGIALATGAPLQAGLVAAAVGGLVAGRLGGSALQVSGPAAGLTVVTADLIHRYGWRTTCAITVLAGLAQLGLGCLRVARTALAVSPAIVHGMLAGIGVTIAVAQLHIVLGGTPQSSVLANLLGLPAQVVAVRPAALVVSTLTLTLLLLWPRLPGRAGRLLRKVPAALVAVSGATAVAAFTGLTLPRVALPSWSSHALAGLPEGPALGLVAAVLTITLVCSVQSLLGAVAVDKLVASRATSPDGAQPADGTGSRSAAAATASSAVTGSTSADASPATAPSTPRVARSDLDRELLGQGAANIVSGALGGLPIAGVAVRSSANVRAGAVSRNSTMLHGVLVVVAALLMVPILELIPLAALAALVMAVGIQMVSLHHIRTVTRHREVLVYAVTTLGVVFLNVLQGVALGIAVAVATALHRLARTRITHDEKEGVHHVRVRGQLTFLAVPRLSRALHLVPHGAPAVVELDGSFMDHAAYETLQDWQKTHTAHGGSVEFGGRRPGLRIAEPVIPHADEDADCRCGPWTPWRNHQCDLTSLAPTDTGDVDRRPDTGTATSTGTETATGTSTSTSTSTSTDPADVAYEHTDERRNGHPDWKETDPHPQPTTHQLVRGISAFQRNTAPLVRDELERLAREGQRPSQLFLTCADSRLVTSMITSSGPGDLFVVRNVGNLVPLPGEDSGDDSVAAAIEYAVDVLEVRSITVCGHSGCGAMQALLNAEPGEAHTPLRRWLRHGLPSLERMADDGRPWARLAGRAAADAVEQLCLTNVVQQLDHLRAHASVDRALRAGALELHGMYFHVGEAQAYLLTEGRVFDHVRPVDVPA
ncbi:bifunctional SulP family inorganic anion transporter/carbonic anhydrase [Streptomyces longwoodensis]|uniref:bifunctional SulP family inorganic anion transporter/carbonic anhydrase n=1 Tax=Streptomyces longwoodensis TaxID=68231 RepID=UPI002256FE6D|nr:SulP family inorganic anion transporter [Streptomyces longwoodensis]MCX4995060.1 SulP family inorganic anion transporter [Streptomyces longwoodensis]